MYCGEQYDSHLGQYYLRARYYDPANGRFNRMDDFGGNPVEPTHLHKYNYAGGNPINCLDPGGMDWFFTELGKAVHKRVGEMYQDEHGVARWLLGSRYLQPYEEGLLTAYPNEYIVVERDEMGKLHMLVPCGKADKASGGCYRRGRELNKYIGKIRPGYRGGQWSMYIAGPIFRFFGDEVIECDWHNTPLSGMVHEIREVIEDKAGNLWIDAGFYSGARHVFVKSMSRFEVKSDAVPSDVKYSLMLPVRLLLDGEGQAGSRVFWRFEGEGWQCSKTGDAVTIDFAESGRYEVEVAGMGPLGGLTANRLHFGIQANVPFPETVLTTAKGGPYTCDDLTWVIPAEAVPSEPGKAARLSYRVNGGEYRSAYKVFMVLFGEMKPGEYRVEVAASEDEHRYDRTPLVFDIKYAPNYELIVERRVAAITVGDRSQAESALSELKLAGTAAVPILERKLAEARQAAKLISDLERLLFELRQKQEDKAE